MALFTASREDFKLYFTCPRKLALKTMGIKVREFRRSPSLAPSLAIGMSGEELTEEILEIIASVQVDRSKGEYVEVLEKRPRIVEQDLEDLVEAMETEEPELSTVGEGGPLPERVARSVEGVVDSAVSRAFSAFKMIDDVQAYEEMLKKQMREGFLKLLSGMIEKLPKIRAVYKPILRNRDTCSLGRPDYYIETTEGPVLVEVKNMEHMERAMEEGEANLLFYGSLLADLELSDSVWYGGKLPRPVKSLVVIPRWGVVREVSRLIPNFREVAVEIWKIKRAALIEGALPEITPVSTICKRCQYRRFCEEQRSEKLELARPIPLIYAIAESEAKEHKEQLEVLRPPQGFWDAYLDLSRRVKSGDEHAEVMLNKMREYLEWFHLRELDERAKLLYRVMPNEFDEWGGPYFLKSHYRNVAVAAHSLFSQHESDVKAVLRVARRRWNI